MVEFRRAVEGEQVDALQTILHMRTICKPSLSWLQEGKQSLVDGFSQGPEALVFEDIVILIVKLDVFQDDIDHPYILPMRLKTSNQPT